MSDERRELMLEAIDLLATAVECVRDAYVALYDHGADGGDEDRDHESDAALELDTARTDAIKATALIERIAAMCGPG
jgi:hypothetical protein